MGLEDMEVSLHEGFPQSAITDTAAFGTIISAFGTLRLSSGRSLALLADGSEQLDGGVAFVR